MMSFPADASYDIVIPEGSPASDEKGVPSFDVLASLRRRYTIIQGETLRFYLHVVLPTSATPAQVESYAGVFQVAELSIQLFSSLTRFVC